MSGLDFIVVGLGNPGRQYEKTRHNAGFIAVDFLASKYGADINVNKFNGLLGTCEINGRKILFLKPQTYMNLSGSCVFSAMKFYKLPPEKVILIFDDISFDVGKIRIRKKGSHGGQNGVKNIISLSGSENFPRIKIGVGLKPNNSWDLANWVLSRFTADEFSLLEKTLNNVSGALELILDGQIENAMSLYN